MNCKYDKWTREDFIEEIKVIYPEAKVESLDITELRALFHDLEAVELYHRDRDYYTTELQDTINEYKEA
jgi:hypothetical protein